MPSQRTQVSSNHQAFRWGRSISHYTLCAVVFAAGCGVEAGDLADNTPTGPYEELRVAGLMQYVGADEAVVESTEASVTTWTWPVDLDGGSPACFRGGQYRMATRDSDSNSEDLVVFLQGGGACWSDLCLAFNVAKPGIPDLDILSSELAANPVRKWNLVYLPYCDASLFAGDAKHLKPDGTLDRDHRGLRNLSAALTVARDRFPKPRRILLAGSSGGAYGTILGLPLVRMVWPDARIDVMNDAGIGIGKPGEPAFMDKVLTEFNVKRFLPKSCAKCQGASHLTEVIAWGLERDPSVRMGAFSSTRDFVISNLFLKLDGPVFEAAVRGETKALEDRVPGRFAAFLTPGTTHTTLLGDIAGFVSGTEDGGSSSTLAALSSFLGGIETTKTGDVTFADWLAAFIDDGEAWKPVAP